MSNGSDNNKPFENEEITHSTQVYDLKEIYSNLNHDKLIRGDTLENVEHRCLELCQAYIAGSWLNASSVDDIEVCRITGGLTNQLYRVRLRDTVPRVPNNNDTANEPYDVAIKMYLDKHISSDVQNEDERLNDVIVCTILSQTQISPTVHGIFKGGVIMDFIPNERFSVKHQNNPTLLRKLAHLLACVHNLNVPIRKRKEWYWDRIEDRLDFAYANCQLKELPVELNLSTLQSMNLKQECASMRKLIVSRTADPVFCHSDFHGSNILVSEKDDNIFLVDLEYAAYGNRAIDIASFITEWGNEKLDPTKMESPPNDAIETFAQLYIEQCDQLQSGYSRNSQNDLLNLVKDIKICIAANLLFMCIFMAAQTKSFILNVPFNRKANMRWVEHILKNYVETKQKYIDEGIIELQQM